MYWLSPIQRESTTHSTLDIVGEPTPSEAEIGQLARGGVSPTIGSRHGHNRKSPLASRHCRAGRRLTRGGGSPKGGGLTNDMECNDPTDPHNHELKMGTPLFSKCPILKNVSLISKNKTLLTAFRSVFKIPLFDQKWAFWI